MDSEPPQPIFLIALALLPALLAGGYAIIGATAASLSSARQAALRDSLSNDARNSLARYLDSRDKIETRWLVLRALGLTSSVFALAQLLAAQSWTGALLIYALVILVYTLPAELGRQFARPRAEKLLPQLLKLAKIGEWCVMPIADPLYGLGRIFSGPKGARKPSATLTETEVELLVNEGELNGSLDHEQSEMIRNVLDFGDVTAEELMVPRIQIDGLSAASHIDELQSLVSVTQHSRYPVYSDSIDKIVGILHVKDLFHAVAEGLDEKSAFDIARKPVTFVPEGQLASTVLKEMRAGRQHMAVVVDEFGGVSGILTLEDLLEEIVGDIQDEHDRDEAMRIEMLGAHSARVDASLPVADVNRALGTRLPEGDYVSLGGLLQEHLHALPQQGSLHDLFGIQVRIVEADARRIAAVELSEVPGIPHALTSRPPSSSN